MSNGTKDWIDENAKQCHCEKCDGAGGVYYDLCDSCMTRFNIIEARVKELLNEKMELLEQIRHEGFALGVLEGIKLSPDNFNMEAVDKAIKELRKENT